ncbi:SRPBCC family protein [Vallicoccus soli]|uniref:Carbon monoxide dehydrogenase n=1 Tax=Vallicoccus soli TaxID=2339232 RepID=A0A3A3YY84_9ACTN|nr:carbon monoxide dehydrogenase subunit G [Vallicoccus soli]RJK96720.1 carbon monoxide dehydrogenase [Vallicoccus soli]
MKVTGTAVLHAPVERVWSALNDPAVLVRTIPGCERLEEVGPDRYRMTVTAGVASIKGSYVGEVALTEQQRPGSFVLRASGSGAPGTVSADVLVRLEEAPEGTHLAYDADAVVGGPVGGVGQRVLTGVARKTAGEFFRAVDDVLAGGAQEGAAEPAAAVPAARPAPEDGPLPAPPAAPGPAVHVPPPPPPAAAGGQQPFVLGALVGAGAALLGALVGGLVARRR